MKAGSRIETKLIHGGGYDPIDGAVTMPIFQSATFEPQGGEGYHELRYIRLNNTPNHVALHRQLASLENAEAALVTASGMAAISTALLTLLKPGDHLLAQRCLYGGTHDLLTQDFPAFGISFDFIDADQPASWPSLIRPNTRAIYVESISNPLLEVADLKAVVEFAKAHGMVSIVDNTFATPINFRPPEIGFDLSIHSATKYLNGHDDIAAGAIIGSKEFIRKIALKLNHFGGSLDPHACFLLQRGIKTLAVRVRYQNESAMKIARFLEGHRKVSRVIYPGLQKHPHHNRANDLFDGFGGMISFELDGGIEAADRFAKNITIPACAPSLGGVHSLVTIPSRTSHSAMSRQERVMVGIAEGLIRLSVGLEATEDLGEDLDHALSA